MFRESSHSIECRSRNVLDLTECVHPSGRIATTSSITLSLEAMNFLPNLVHSAKDDWSQDKFVDLLGQNAYFF